MDRQIRRASVPSVALIAICLLAGCGGGGPADPTPFQPGPSTSATAPAPTPSPTDDPSAGTTHALPPTALALAVEMHAAGLPMTKIAKQSAHSDPNKLLGKHNGYAERVSFDYAGGDKKADKYAVARGGVIERWNSRDRAVRRMGYLAASLRLNPARGKEYDFVVGDLLVRLSGKLTLAQAHKVQGVLNRLS